MYQLECPYSHISLNAHIVIRIVGIKMPSGLYIYIHTDVRYQHYHHQFVNYYNYCCYNYRHYVCIAIVINDIQMNIWITNAVDGC